jgi:hypothetical protein
MEWTVWNGAAGSCGVTLNFRKQYVVVEGTVGSWWGFRNYRWRAGEADFRDCS